MKKIKLVGLLLTSLVLVAGCSVTNDKETSSTDNKSEIVTKDKSEKSGEVVFYITRHGKTLFNEMKKVQGWSDTPLTEPGVEVAKKLGEGLKAENITFDKVYSSDSGRAIETTKLITKTTQDKKTEIIQDKNLRELYFGKFEGDLDEYMWGEAAKTLGYENEEAVKKDIKELGLEKITNAMAENDETNQFETYDTVRKRMQKEVTKIAEETSKEGGGNVLIVSHGMAITALLSDWTDEDTDRPLPNASISKVVYKDGTFTVETVGDTSFIEK